MPNSQAGLASEADQINMTERLRLVLSHKHVDPRLTQLVARAGLPALEALLDLYGGEKPHIPSASNFWEKLLMAERDRDIWARWDGREATRKQLMAEYGLALRSFQKIIKRMSDWHRRPVSDDQGVSDVA